MEQLLPHAGLLQHFQGEGHLVGQMLQRREVVAAQVTNALGMADLNQAEKFFLANQRNQYQRARQLLPLEGREQAGRFGIVNAQQRPVAETEGGRLLQGASRLIQGEGTGDRLFIAGDALHAVAAAMQQIHANHRHPHDFRQSAAQFLEHRGRRISCQEFFAKLIELLDSAPLSDHPALPLIGERQCHNQRSEHGQSRLRGDQPFPFQQRNGIHAAHDKNEIPLVGRRWSGLGKQAGYAHAIPDSES